MQTDKSKRFENITSFGSHPTDTFQAESVALTGLHVVFFPSIPLCSLINQHLSVLAKKFPQTKFLKSISTTCIPNYPDHNLPTIFVYFEGEMKAQFIGPLVFGGMNLKVEGRKQQDFKHTF